MTDNNDNNQATTLLQQAQILLKASQFKSAETVASFGISSKLSDSPPPTNITIRVSFLEVLGDAAAGQGKYRQAVHYYRKGLLLVQPGAEDTVEIKLHKYNTRSRGRFQNNHTNVSLTKEELEVRRKIILQKFIELKTKESRYLVKAGDLIEARRVLEEMSPQSNLMTCEMCMLLGQLYLFSERKADASKFYRNALKLNPFCIEAIEVLATLNLAKEEHIFKAVEDGLRAISLKETESLIPFKSLIKTKFDECSRNDYTKALALYRKLSQTFPQNKYIMTEMAMLNIKLNQNISAAEIFRLIRTVDPHSLECMDYYARLLYRKHEEQELQELSQSLLRFDDHIIQSRPEPWICLALNTRLMATANNKNNSAKKEKALEFLDKAIAIDPRHSLAHVVRGDFLLEDSRLDHAIMSYFRANSIKIDMESYQGLVEANLAAERFKDAFHAAKNALHAFSKDSRAYLLVGLALSKPKNTSVEGLERAKKALLKAHSIDPSAIRPLIELVNLNLREENGLDSCIELLSKGMKNLKAKEEKDVLHSKLGDVHVMQSNFDEAFKHYQIAISLNPNNTDAQLGLENIDRLFRGSENDVSLMNQSNLPASPIYNRESID